MVRVAYFSPWTDDADSSCRWPVLCGGVGFLGCVGPPVAGLVEAEAGESIGVFDPRRNEVFVLNETASDVWRLADGRYEIGQVVGLLASSYAIEPEAIRADVERAVAMLRECGLLNGKDS